MRAPAVILALLAGAAIAAADVLDIPGNYGTPEGCKWLADSEYGEGIVALTPEGYESFDTGCEFLQALRARDGSHVATMLCSHEGETFRSVEFLHIVKAGEGDAYDLFSETGMEMGRVERCG